MSDFDVSQILSQMRAINAGVRAPEKIEGQQVSNLSFGDLLSQSVEMVNKTQKEATDLKKSFQTGTDDVELPEVMIGLQKANISFEAMKQVRNKLLSAYQEIMNMQV